MSTRFAATEGDKRDAALLKPSTHAYMHTLSIEGKSDRAGNQIGACKSKHSSHGTHTTRATHTPPSLPHSRPYLLDELIEHGVVLLERLVLGQRHSPGRARWRRRRKEC